MAASDGGTGEEGIGGKDHLEQVAIGEVGERDNTS
jgi:hypothetical protein